MKKRALAILLVAVLLLSSVVLYSSGETVNKLVEYTKTYSSSSNGAKVTSVTVTDNYNFTAATSVKITNADTYYSARRDVNLYSASNSSTSNVADWEANPDAEIRFWIKVPHAVSFTLRLNLNAGGKYPAITAPVSVGASDNWQEVRVKRSSFGNDTNFKNSAASSGTMWIQLRTAANASGFLNNNEEIYISPVQVYDGQIPEAVDPNGGTIIITPVDGEKIADYSNAAWNDSSKGFSIEGTSVEDNRNFTTARKITVTDKSKYNEAATAKMNIYSATNTVEKNISKWATTPYAQLRFWVKVPHAVKFTLRFEAATGSASKVISTTVSIPASDKWQEIRISRDSFTADSGFDTAVAGACTVYTQICTAKDTTEFLAQNESMYIGVAQLFDGLVPGTVDPDGGTVIIVPTDGVKISEANTAEWNANDKGYKVETTKVADNENFTTARKLTVTDSAKYYSYTSVTTSMFSLRTNEKDIRDWAKTSYAELRLWVKTDKAVTFTLRLNCEVGSSFKIISTKVTTAASDNWQEIRIPRSAFNAGGDFNQALNENGKVYVQILTNQSDTFLSKDQSLLISPVWFYDGYVPGTIDPDGGTIIIPDNIGEKIATFEPSIVQQYDGMNMSTVSVVDNPFVFKAMKLTVTDKDLFYSAKRQLYISSKAATDISEWNDYPKSDLRFWVKVPKAMKLTFSIVEVRGSDYPAVSATVDVPYSADWQEVIVPRSAISYADNFTGEAVRYIRIIPSDAENFLDFSESLYISHFEIYNGIIPSSASNPDSGKVGKLLYTAEANPANYRPGASTTAVAVESNKNFTKAVSIQIIQARTFAQTDGKHIVHNKKFNVADWYNNENAQLRFWVKTDKDLILNIGLQNGESKLPSSNKSISAQISVKGSDNWQEIRLSRKHFTTSKDFDSKTIAYITVKGTGDNGITTNETFLFGNCEFYDGIIPTPIDKNGGTTAKSNENAIIATYSSHTPKIQSGTGLTAEYVKVNVNKYFTTATQINATSATKFNVSLKRFYDATDISRGKTGTLRLWALSKNNASFNIVLTDSKGNTVVLPYTIKGSSNWQELRADLSKKVNSSFDYTKLVDVSVSGDFKAGTVIEIGKIELWKSALKTEVDATGGTIDPPLVLPPEWDKLPKMSADEANDILVRTNNSFWMSDWNNTSRPRSITSSLTSVDKKDAKYSWFSRYRNFKVVSPDVYYANPSPALFYLKSTDITPYIKTGTLRFWVNVPKNMSLKVTLLSIDADGVYSRSSVEIKVKKTTENDGFQEIQIPLKDFYDAAVKAKTKWNPYCVRHVEFGGISGCDAKTFLKKDEVLSVSHFEIWKGAALEPEPFDPTRFFYSTNGKYYVKDVNEVLAKTARVNGFKNVIEASKYAQIVSKYFTDSKFLHSYTIHIVSASDYDYKVVDAYDNIELYIPAYENVNEETLSIFVYNKNGIHKCDYIVVDGYFVIDTMEFGEFLFIEKAERNDVVFDHIEDLEEIFGINSDKENSKGSVQEFVGKIFGSPVVIAVICVVVLAGAGLVVFIVLKKKSISKKGKDINE